MLDFQQNARTISVLAAFQGIIGNHQLLLLQTAARSYPADFRYKNTATGGGTVAAAVFRDVPQNVHHCRLHDGHVQQLELTRLCNHGTTWARWLRLLRSVIISLFISPNFSLCITQCTVNITFSHFYFQFCKVLIEEHQSLSKSLSPHLSSCTLVKWTCYSGYEREFVSVGSCFSFVWKNVNELVCASPLPISTPAISTAVIFPFFKIQIVSKYFIAH